MKKLLFILLLLAFKASVAQEFGNNGTVITDISGGNDYMSKMVVQEDGKLVAIGSINYNSFVVVRYNSDGSLDESYGNSGIVITRIGENDWATGIAIQKDGKIVVVGIASNVLGFAVVRYNNDGSLDTTFDEDGIAITFFPFLFSHDAYTAAIQADGKIVVGGISSFKGTYLYTMTRYNTNGSVDYSFGNSGIVRVAEGTRGNGSTIKAIALQTDGKIVAAGSSGALLRFNSDGSLDKSFNEDGIIIVDKAGKNEFNDVLLQEDGKIIASGTSFNNSSFYSLFRFNTDGTADSSFNNSGSVLGPAAYDVPAGIIAAALQNDGKIVALSENGFVLRFNNNGTPDSTFYDNGQKKISFGGKAGTTTTLKLYGNYIYIGGYVNNDSDETPNYDFAITRLDNLTNISFTCPASVTVNNDKESCGAVINNISPVFGQGTAEINFALTGATNTTGGGDASGSQFNTGTTTITYSLKDNPANTCSFTVTVNDAEAPVISGLSPSVTSLWPPNHKMHTIMLSYDSKDNCGLESCNVTVTSNEQGYTPDWTVVNDHEISLRAERNGDGNGRIYTIKVVCTDEVGNESAPATTIVTVPHSKGKNVKINSHDESYDIDEADKENTLIVTASPNPSPNYFVIKVENATDLLPVTLKILDQLGRVVESKNVVETHKSIIVGSELHKGIYFGEIIQGTRKKVVRLVKQ